MERDKISTIAMIAIILGAIGAGVGGFAAGITLTGGADGEDGDEGDDGAAGITTITYITEDQYPCSSEAEINAALDAIGTGNGKIMITEDITLTSSIKINGGGSYIIEGTGFHTIAPGGNYDVFNITDAKLCKITDLIINVSVWTTQWAAIDIDETNDNPVYIENIQMYGDDAPVYLGFGIRMDSDNVWISNCQFENMSSGLFGNSNYGHFYNNKVSNSNAGIYITGDNYTVEGNHFSLCNNYGMSLTASYYNTIANNIIIGIQRAIKFNNVNFTTITGNTIYGLTLNNLDVCGIQIETNSGFNVITGNLVLDYISTGTGVGKGIYIKSVNCIQNTVVGNTALYCSHDNFDDDGTNTFGNYTNNNFA